jgi:hypothetical protein
MCSPWLLDDGQASGSTWDPQSGVALQRACHDPKAPKSLFQKRLLQNDESVIAPAWRV